MSEYCEYCDDGTGHCAYPYYGVAPHKCYDTIGKPFGGSEQIERGKWPENFEWDPEYGDPDSKEGQHPGCVVYTHCLRCGGGR